MGRLKDHSLGLMRARPSLARSHQLTSRAMRGVPITVPFLAFAAMGLLVLSRLNHTAIVETRWRLTEMVTPLLSAAMVPFAPVRDAGRRITAQINLTDELERLKAENQKLNMWEWRARELERKLAQLETLSKVIEQPGLPFITARVIAEQSGAFAHSVIIDSGQNANLAIGFPVISADGLIGRIVEVGPKSARVLLVNDQASRIPVVVGANGVRAILVGENASDPQLKFVDPNAEVRPGDEIATSGVGGMFPRGLRIGQVAGAGPEPRVSLRSTLNALDYVSILFFTDPNTGTGPDAKAQDRLPSDGKTGSTPRDQAGLKRDVLPATAGGAR